MKRAVKRSFVWELQLLPQKKDVITHSIYEHPPPRTSFSETTYPRQVRQIVCSKWWRILNLSGGEEGRRIKKCWKAKRPSNETCQDTTTGCLLTVVIVFPSRVLVRFWHQVLRISILASVGKPHSQAIDLHLERASQGPPKASHVLFVARLQSFFYLPPPNCLNLLPWKRGDRKGNVCYRRRKQRLTAKRAAHHATSLPREQSGWDWESGEGEETGAWCIPIAFPPTCRHSTHNFSEWILSFSPFLAPSLLLSTFSFIIETVVWLLSRAKRLNDLAFLSGLITRCRLSQHLYLPVTDSIYSTCLRVTDSSRRHTCLTKEQRRFSCHWPLHKPSLSAKQQQQTGVSNRSS